MSYGQEGSRHHHPGDLGEKLLVPDFSRVSLVTKAELLTLGHAVDQPAFPVPFPTEPELSPVQGREAWVRPICVHSTCVDRSRRLLATESSLSTGPSPSTETLHS